MKSEKKKYTIGSLFGGKLVLGLLSDGLENAGFLLVADEENGWSWYETEVTEPNSQWKFEKSDDLKSGQQVFWKSVEREQIVFTDEIVDESFSNIVNEINDELYDR